MLFLDNNPEKSFTVSVFTVLCKILVSSFDSSESLLVISSNELFICSPSSVDTSLIGNAEINPIITATIDVIMKTLIIPTIIFPNLLGCVIFAIAVDIFKNTNGTIIINIKFKNKSPNGLSTAAFSLNIIPTIAPIIIANNSIIVDL